MTEVSRARDVRPDDAMAPPPRLPLGWIKRDHLIYVASIIALIVLWHLIATTLFKPGDAVYYAGSVIRQGTNSELHLVDERIVGRKPANLSFAEAAALPLTTLTAWELMFDRMGISRTGGHAGRSMLILGGAGGVGSIAIQLAKRLARLHVTASASRPESRRLDR